MAPQPIRLHYENAAGRLSEQAEGRRDGHIVVEYVAGPRQLGDLQTLLGYAKRLLALRGWHKVLGDQRWMEPFTPEEEQWVIDLWLNVSYPRTTALIGAVVLHPDVFAQLSDDVVQAQAQVSAMSYRLFDDPATAKAWLEQLP